MSIRKQSQRGLTLIEIMASLGILGVAALGLVGSMVVAINGNSLAARRTLMSEFAQARMERLVSMTRNKIPSSNFTNFGGMVAPGSLPDVNGVMSTSGQFDGNNGNNTAPGTGGWVLDVIDGAAPATAGDDPMFGPVLFDDTAGNGSDTFMARTNTLRVPMANTWLAGNGSGASCADPVIVSDPGVLCREVHIEPYNPAGVPLLRVWVRVVQGGGDWHRSYVTMTEDIAQ